MGGELNPYQDALRYLYARTTGAWKFGLERTQALVEALGNPHHRFPVLHVAGTNGKGSSVATAEALLRATGLRVGKYTSPHLVDFRERIVVNGLPIAGDKVVSFVDQWTPFVERIGATFFEATTVLAFDYFAAQGVDVALIETGLGGRLDTTNVVDPLSAGVTSIGYDHMEYLGSTLEAIAREKGGIFKPGRPAVIGVWEPGIRSLLAAQATEAGASDVRVVAERFSIANVVVDSRGTEFTLTGLGDSRRLRTPLVGQHQTANLAFALDWLDAAGPPYRVTPAEAQDRLAGVSIPGRFQRAGKYLFDVAHNADGARVLAETLAAVRPPGPVVGVICALGDKDWRGMLTMLRPCVSSFVLTNAPTAPESRAWRLADVVRYAEEAGIEAIAEPDFDKALRLGDDRAATVLVTGSFHTVGDAMSRLHVSPLG